MLIKINQTPKTFRILSKYFYNYLKKNNQDIQGESDILISSFYNNKQYGIYLFLDKYKKISGYIIITIGLEPNTLFVVQASTNPNTGKELYESLLNLCKKHGFSKIQWITNRKTEHIWNKAIKTHNGIKEKGIILETNIGGV